MKLFVIISAVAALSIARFGHHVSAAPGYGYQGPPAPLAHDGTVLDTPEVAKAKAAHLAAHAAASARASHGYQYDQGPYGYNEDAVTYDGASYSVPYNQGYRGPSAPLAHDGRVVDTPEVAQAKAAHLAAHAHAAARTNHYGNYGADDGYRGQVAGHGYAVPVQITYTHTAPGGYQGPFAPLGQDGRVIDTPEVAQARAAHLQAYAHAASLAVADHGGYTSGVDHSEYTLGADHSEYTSGADHAGYTSGGDHAGYTSGETPVHEPSSAEGPSHEESYY